MEEENSAPTKRVSFAPSAQINYIYQDESTATKTSSFYSDAPMDITTELEDLKNLNIIPCFENANKLDGIKKSQWVKHEPSDFLGLPLCAEETHSNDSSCESSNAPRKSLNPIDFGVFRYSEDQTNNEARKSLNPLERVEFRYENSRKSEESMPKSTELFWNTNTNKPDRRSLEGAFETHETVNSSFEVDELINTIDLRKIIPQLMDNTPDISEFLAAQGIRFLDEMVVDGMKRDTLSKSRNMVDPALIVYYESSLKERIDFLFNFSNFLIDKMKDLEKEIEVASKAINVKAINKENLKRIRNDARNKAKIDWYSLRKIYEIQFNKKILENKNKVSDMLEKTTQENTKTEEAVESKRKSVELLREQVHLINEQVSTYDQKNLQMAGDATELLEEKKEKQNRLQNELKTAQQVLNTQKTEENAVQKRINKLNEEISNLKKNLMVRNVSEAQLEEQKRVIERYSTVFGFAFVSVGSHSLSIELGREVTVLVECTPSKEVIRHSASSKSTQPLHEFLCSTIAILHEFKLLTLIQQCVDNHAWVQALTKEISVLKEKTKIDCFYLNGSLCLRVFAMVGNECFDVEVTNRFDLLANGQLIENIKNNPGTLTWYIHSRTNN